MTGRERFACILEGREPDRFPLYIPTIACTVASAILGRTALGGADSLHFEEERSLLLGPDAHAEFEVRLIEDNAALYRLLGVDVVRETWRSRMIPSRQIDENTLLFGDADGEYVVKRFFPMQQAYGIIVDTRKVTAVEGLEAALRAQLRMPSAAADEAAIIAGVRSSEALFAKLADLDLGHILPGGMEGLGYEPAWMMLAHLEPALMRSYFSRSADYAIARMRVLRKRGYRWFNGGADMASQTGMLYSPQLFADVVMGSLRRFADACADVGAIYCYRSDGNLWQVFDLLFGATGIQGYGECDRDAGMTAGLIHARNPRLRILGNVSSALLAQGTVEQVRQETVRMLREAEGAPLIAGPSNAIVHGTPPQNVWAMVEAIKEYRI